MQSFLWRAYGPQIALLLAIQSVSEACPNEPDETGGRRLDLLLLRSATVLLGTLSAWVVGLSLTGFYHSDCKLPSLPGWAKNPIVWLWMLAPGVLLFFVAAQFMFEVYVAQLLPYLLCSLGLYSVFAKTLGPAILERAKAEKGKQDRRDAAALIRLRMTETQEEMKRAKESPLAEEMDNEIMALQSRLDRLKQELEIIERGA